MRIISGKWRGKQIQAPEKLPARPTTDRAKESLFNWLQFRIDFDGISVLELFSGTGNISYEFISRGADLVVAIDENHYCVRFIDKTFKALQADSAEVMQMEVLAALKMMSRDFDIVFADPPYDFQHYDELISLVMGNKLVKEDGWFILEHAAEFNPSSHEGFYETRKYGKVHFSYFSILNS
ncbi:MAG: 16S rRNA (guanine(966)-N(2))-methyltransferase RsmD [Bacteroidia bacterium]